MALLENETIRLRALEPEDLDLLYQWENDARLWRNGSTLTPYSRFALRDYLSSSLSMDIFQSRQLRLMIVDKKTGLPVGTLDLYDFDPHSQRAGVGILLDAAYRRKGLGYQALQLVQEYAFRFLFLNQLYAYVPATNLPSYRLFEKCGYQKNGVLKAWLKTAEGFGDVYVMQLFL